MIQRLLFSAAVIISVSSCGGGKKLKASQAEATQLQANNKMLTRDLDAAKRQAADLTTTNGTLTSQMETCQRNVQTTEQKLAATQAVIREEQAKMQKVQEKLDAGMADFESKGVEITTKDGVIYVSMADKLLYKTGQSTLSTVGKDALVHLAEVLNGYPQLDVIVLGNTDDVQFKSGSDNWTLSTERANGVIRVLKDAKVDPARLTAAGRARFNPVADNSTPEGRAKNRRTDIILNPDVKRVWESMGQ